MMSSIVHAAVFSYIVSVVFVAVLKFVVSRVTDVLGTAHSMVLRKDSCCGTTSLRLSFSCAKL
jgi:hypothetical protein